MEIGNEVLGQRARPWGLEEPQGLAEAGPRQELAPYPPHLPMTHASLPSADPIVNELCEMMWLPAARGNRKQGAGV